MALFEAKLESFMKENQQNPNKHVEDMMSSHVATPPQVNTPQSEQGTHPLQGQYTNQKCELLHWYNFETEEEVVAEGHIASKGILHQLIHALKFTICLLEKIVGKLG